ncbi:hypothetical protein [Pedobacter jamesrossensis]|uniref:Uncharacterized protein n=1 Tax=Pedobacter jamesrossensis TaxID=1908238 RepID=A0ABV8NJE8_9SPHI
MKQKLPIGRALLIALIFTIIYLFVIFTLPEFNNYGGLFLFFVTPGVFIGVVVWCYLLLVLESAKIIAPHFVFRFLVPFLFFSLLIWVIGNIVDEPIISAFQAYSFKEYVGYFFEFMKSAVMILGSIFFVLATLFTLLVKKEELTQNI